MSEDLKQKDNIDSSYEEIKVSVFVKTCQTPPDNMGIFRIIEELIKKISADIGSINESIAKLNANCSELR